MAKDEVHFVDKEYLKGPILPEMKYLEEPIEVVASFLPDGRINLECPCLQSALAHRCGHLMRAAVKCYNDSKKSPKGVECEEKFMFHAMCVGPEDKDN